MNIIIESCIPLLLLLGIGLLIIQVSKTMDHLPLLPRLGFAYGIGTACITLQMMLYSFVGIPWTLTVLFIPWGIMGIIGIVSHRVHLPSRNAVAYPFGGIDNILFAGIIATCFFVVFEAVVHPLLAFDGWANWFLAGKAFFLSRNIDPSYIMYANNSNPPIINLLITFVYICLGKMNDSVGILFFSYYYLSLLCIFYYYAQKFAAKRSALIFTFLLASTQNIIRHAGRFDVGHADLPLGFFFFCSAVLFLEFIQRKSLRNHGTLFIFLTAAALIKSEGIPFYILLQILMLSTILPLKKEKMLFYLIHSFSFGIIIFWYIFKHIFSLPENPFLQQHIYYARIPVVFFYMLKEFTNFNRWNLLWIAYFIVLPFCRNNKYFRILSGISLVQLGSYFFVYLTTPLNLIAHITSSFDRLLLQVCPIAFLLICVVQSSLGQKNQRKK